MAEFIGNIASKVLGMETGVGIVIPEGTDPKAAPVVYLLHGLSDNHTGWRRYTRVESYAREHGAVLIMPEAGRSFYTDCDLGLPYFTYISEELPELMTRIFRIDGRPENTYIMGLSMGGYGALKCALTSPHQYAGCAAFSSVCDLREAVSENLFSMKETGEHRAYFGGDGIAEKDDLFFLLKECKKTGRFPKTFLTCGTEDFLFPMNERFLKAAKEAGANPECRFLPGDHRWEFWDASVREAFRYFFGEA